GQVALDLLGELRGRALEREGETARVGLAQDELDGAVVEVDDVLEGEHEAAHLLGEGLVALAELLEDLLLGARVGAVEDLDEGLDAAHRRRRLTGGEDVAGAPLQA